MVQSRRLYSWFGHTNSSSVYALLRDEAGTMQFHAHISSSLRVSA